MIRTASPEENTRFDRHSQPERGSSHMSALATSSRRGLWIRNGTLAITDQALISGSNFVLSILMARSLEPAEYGVYALGFAAYLFVLAFFQALILEPFIVLGASEYHDQFASYLAGLLRLQGLLSLIQVCLFVAGAIVCALISPLRPGVGVLLGLAVGSPLLLLFWLLRIASYVASDAGAATRAAVVYCAVLLAAIGIADVSGHLSAQTAFSIMGLAAAVASVRLIRQLKPAWRPDDEGPGSLSAISLALEHWNFGRWELSKAGVDWICENMSFAVSGSILGVAQAGSLKALVTLFLPLSQTLTALRRIVLPHLSGTYRHKGPERTAAAIRSVMLLYGSGALLYSLGIARALGKEGYQRLLEKIRPLILESEYNVYRLQPDLSYLRPTTGK